MKKRWSIFLKKKTKIKLKKKKIINFSYFYEAEARKDVEEGGLTKPQNKHKRIKKWINFEKNYTCNISYQPNLFSNTHLTPKLGKKICFKFKFLFWLGHLKKNCNTKEIFL